MSKQVDFSKPNTYGGDTIEETFKPFTSHHIPFWWHFREVMRAPQRKQDVKLKRISGKRKKITDEECRLIIGLSLTNYAVYTNLAEALSFLEELQFVLNRFVPAATRLFEVRRKWKALYSSLYSSLNALSNILCVVVGDQPFVYKGASNQKTVWNYSPERAYKYLNGKGVNTIASPLNACISKLVIRSQLDHYWLIWHYIGQGKFLIDENFLAQGKGWLPIDPQSEVKATFDAYAQAEKDVIEIARAFNVIYEELSVTGKWFDKFLSSKGLEMDYSDFAAHGNKRPTP